MTPLKRIFDLLAATLLAIMLAPFLLTCAVVVLILDGRPVLYLSERMKTPTQGFTLIKFRTMRPDPFDSGPSGGDKSNRITKTGALLRKTRFDEVPQLWNVLKGDISFVGPRPPLREIVERFPKLYAQVLRSRPGITGLASVYFHAHEEWLLKNSGSREETDAIYSRVCVPRKAKIDLMYQRNRNLCFDMSIMLKTVFKSLR
ncbi:sugar transferase [Aliiroseovarius subalbicans]|uniref:sugar transferase n=1 Tax=Aliiroseovarius subalbicans TaxID=2925840 RepID=UPI001F56757D|nr:sugar transferase [Aliiroseovarius subalbicans]MCI2397794.1 sugar transferase [Aliiroseovarius subalbicans]